MKPRGFLSIVFLLTLSTNIYSQQNPPNPCEAPESGQFNFWLGEWDLTWPAEQMGGKEGETGKGTNSITRILGDCIVKENFSFPAGDFYGNSVSVYSPARKCWQQTWVDSQGGYLLFTGEFKDGQMILRTEPFKRGEKTYVSRMVFRNITADSLDWDWQRSEDMGQTWKDLWNIHYQRRQTSQSN